jgi:hypothetical protein
VLPKIQYWELGLQGDSIGKGVWDLKEVQPSGRSLDQLGACPQKEFRICHEILVNSLKWVIIKAQERFSLSGFLFYEMRSFLLGTLFHGACVMLQYCELNKPLFFTKLVNLSYFVTVIEMNEYKVLPMK